MPSMLRRASLCLLTCSLNTTLVSAAALPVAGPSRSRGVDGNHDSTTLLRNTSEVLKPDPSRNATSAQEENQQQCWIFMHLQKCGGTTIKKMLKDTWDAECSIYDSWQWKHGDAFSLDLGEKLATGSPWKVMAGGYPEALRRSPSVESSCRFFTMFRHPISRMVSAYFYCQVYQEDAACASEIVRARDVDLLTFAKHWSNFAVRQFALSFVPADDVMAYARTPEARALLPETVDAVENVSGWYLLKMYLERPEVTAAVRGASEQPQLELETAVTTTAHAGDDEEVKKEEEEVPDAQLYGFLEPAQALLSDGYAAVGILEDFNTTLSLFDAALSMPGMDWHQEFEDNGEQNVLSRMKQEKADTLEKAWTDPELKRYMRLDLLLYEHAVDVFHQQARSYGLR